MVLRVACEGYILTTDGSIETNVPSERPCDINLVSQERLYNLGRERVGVSFLKEVNPGRYCDYPVFLCAGSWIGGNCSKTPVAITRETLERSPLSFNTWHRWFNRARCQGVMVSNSSIVTMEPSEILHAGDSISVSFLGEAIFFICSSVSAPSGFYAAIVLPQFIRTCRLPPAEVMDRRKVAKASSRSRQVSPECFFVLVPSSTRMSGFQ